MAKNCLDRRCLAGQLEITETELRVAEAGRK